MAYDYDPLTGDPIARVIASGKATADSNPFIPDMTDDDLRKLARERLSEVLQSVKGTSQPDLTIRAVNAVLDRLDGKPVANVKVDNTFQMLVSNVKADDALLARVRRDLLAAQPIEAEYVNVEE